MDNDLRQTNDVTFSRLGEEETAPEMMKVRNLLLCLPREYCPADLEFRLHRRLDELENGVRPARERLGWGMGWAGLGLGFAVALLIAVVAFDFSFTSPHLSGTGPAITSTTQPQNTANPVVEPQMASQPAQSQADQQPNIATESAQQMAAAKDSNTSKNPPAALPENLYHVVGGNNP